MYGNLSVRFLRRADPSDRNNMLTTFLLAACSFILLISAVTLGAFLIGVLTAIECFAFTATTKMSHHFSHSVLGGIEATSQYAGSPAKADELLEVAPPLDVADSRSAMLTMNFADLIKKEC